MMRRGQRRTRYAMAVSGVALAGFLGISSVAFACSGIMGNLTLTPDSGPPGTVVSTSATGLKPFPAQYDMFFGGTCMTFTGKLVKVITPNASGAWSNVKVTIPKHAKLGLQSLCGVEAYPVAGQTATSHNAFTVV